MSRIGKSPIAIPRGVEVSQSGSTVAVKGPKGSLSVDVRPEIDVEIEGAEIRVSKNGSGAERAARAFHGMTRALINNMVVGVSAGYTKTLNIGFCHPVVFDVPEGIAVETPKPTVIVVTGADKQAVGQFCAVIRAVRPPEPYKGKGIRYEDEQVRRKQGKSFGS